MGWWTGWSKWKFSHGRHCLKTKQAAHVSFTISVGVFALLNPVCFVNGSYPVESFMEAQLLTESVLEWTVKSWCPGIQADEMQHLEVSNLHVKLLISVTDRLSSHSDKLLSVFRKSSLQPSLASLLSLLVQWHFYSSLSYCGCARPRMTILRTQINKLCPKVVSFVQKF